MENTPRQYESDEEVRPTQSHEEDLQSPSSPCSSGDTPVTFLGESDSVEDLNSSVQDLISRHRVGTSPQPKKRDRAFSPTNDSHESPKRRSLTEVSTEAGKFESGKEPEEKKSRSSEPSTGKTDALHDPDDLDSSHVDLQDDPDPQPSLTPAKAEVALHDSQNDLEKDESNVFVEPTSHGDELDLDSSGSYEQFKMMSPEKPESPMIDENMLSLADEFQQAGATPHDDSDSDSSSDSENLSDGKKNDTYVINNDENEIPSTDDSSEDSESDSERNEYDFVQASQKSDSEEVEEKTEVASPTEVSAPTEVASPPRVAIEVASPTGVSEDAEFHDKDKEVFADDANTDAHQESSLDGTELDFSVLQSSQQLNVDVTKQRITLRKKGSLARRRKPTRTSVRSMTHQPEPSLYADSTEPQRPPPPDDDDDDDEEVVSRVERSVVSSTPPDTARDVQMRKAPVLLPGLGDHIKRRTKTPVVLPKTVDQPKPSSETSTPPWMAEVRVRRGSRPLKPESERPPSESRSQESPSWMRDALNKKKRAAEIIERRTSTQHVETEQPSVPPWMKELRRANRPVPTLPSHVANNNGPAPPTETTPSPDSRDHAHKVSNLNDSNLSRQEVFQSPVFNNSIETRSKGREVLAPLKRSSVDNSAHSGMIDNRLATPSYLGTTNGTGPELTSNRNVLPPLKSTSQSSTSQDDQENSESPVPVWKKEIAARRKSKTFVPSAKPETPLRLGEMPAWKRELAERNKIKKRDSIDVQSTPPPSHPSTTSTPTSTPTSTSTSSPSSLPPWQQELAQRRRRTPSITRQPTTESSPSAKDELPPWAKNIEKRRARLADCGLIERSVDQTSG